MAIESLSITTLPKKRTASTACIIVGTCREFYENNIDSFILASSDSDYWGLIPMLEKAHFLVLVESEKVGGAIRHTMEDAGITYCYIDDFSTGNSTEIKERALLKVLEDELDREVKFNIQDLLRHAYEETRVDMTGGEKNQFYTKYIKPMHLEISGDGEVSIKLGTK